MSHRDPASAIPDEVTARTRVTGPRGAATEVTAAPDELVGALPGMTREAASVVCRWNPEGAAQLRARQQRGAPSTTAGSTGGPMAVAVFGPDDANTQLLCAELQRFDPPVEITGLRRPAAGSPARVALVLVDPGAPVGAAAADLVAGLRAAALHIVFAANGIHACEDWTAVRSRDCAVLAGVLGAPPEITGVCTRLAVAARREGDPAWADQSGLRVLHGRLVAAAAEQVLADTRRRIHDEMTALRAPASVVQLQAQRASLLASRDGGRAPAMAGLRNAVSLVRLDLVHEVGARVRATQGSVRAELTRLDRAALRHYPQQLQQALTMVAHELDALVVARLAELAERFEGPPDRGDTRGQAPASIPPRISAHALDLGPDPDMRRRGVDGYLTVAFGASAGFGLGRLLVAPLALLHGLDSAATALIALVLGGAMAYPVVRLRARLADRAVLQQWVADALVNVKAQWEQQMATAVMVTESRASEQILRVSAARVVDTDRQVAELSSHIRRLEARHTAQLAACDRDLTLLKFRTDASGRSAIDQNYTLDADIPAGAPL